MRLIDADYVIEKLNEINGTAELDKAFEVVENAPTVDMLDKIRTEIEALEYLNIEDGSDGYDKYIEQYEVLKIIDKYR